MNCATENISRYIKSKGVEISTLSHETGISYWALQLSLEDGSSRSLRDDELLKLCMFLEVDPMQFAAKKTVRDDETERWMIGEEETVLYG